MRGWLPGQHRGSCTHPATGSQRAARARTSNRSDASLNTWLQAPRGLPPGALGTGSPAHVQLSVCSASSPSPAHFLSPHTSVPTGAQAGGTLLPSPGRTDSLRGSHQPEGSKYAIPGDSFLEYRRCPYFEITLNVSSQRNGKK